MSATSARIRTTTTCKRDVTSAARCLVARCDVLGSPVLPHTPRRHIASFQKSFTRETRHDRYIRADEIRIDGHARSFAARGAAIPRHRPDGFSHRGRSVCDAGDPSFAHAALQRDPGRDGLCGQRVDHGHGGRRPRGRFPQPAHRPPARHSLQPGPARDPDHAVGERARPHNVHDPARAPGSVHGVGLCLDAGLSRRAMHLDGRRRRVRRLHHRQCRQQSDRTAGVGRGGRQLRAGVELLFFRGCSISPARCWCILLFRTSGRCTRCRRRNRPS